MKRRAPRIIVVVIAVLTVAGGIAAIAFPDIMRVLFVGDSRSLREERTGEATGETAKRSPLLILALDGVRRDLLYEMLRKGELPALAALLGGGGAEGFPHAHFEPSALTVLPSSTMPAWASMFTGVAPAVNGVPGDEFFIREDGHFAAPVPISVGVARPLAAIYVDDYLGSLLERPTLYERMREEEPEIRIWVSMSQVYRGADRLLLGSRTVLGEAVGAAISGATGGDVRRPAHAQMSEEVVETVRDELEEARAPEVLTIYFPVIDFTAHHAEEGPDDAIRSYLREVLDPLFAGLSEALREDSALSERFVVVVADHGHSRVLKDETHALSAKPETGPARVLQNAGFRPRPFGWKTDEQDFQAVLAYQGAMAFVYLADRSTCPGAGARCDWTRPPRYEEDLLVAAEAFHAANTTGDVAEKMRGSLELILVRRPKAAPETDEPFSIYTGPGRTLSVDEYLLQHPGKDLVAFSHRLKLLGEGPFGERAGDLLLLGGSGDEDHVAARYYFADPEHSEHGSATMRDSSIPLIVAHPGRSAAELSQLVRAGGGRAALPS